MKPNKAAHRHVEVTVGRFTRTWIKRMNLSHWEIQTVFLDTQLNDEAVDTDFLVTAITECRWNYLQAKVKWSLPSAVRMSDEDLERMTVHELCHVALSPEQALLDMKVDEDAKLEGAESLDKLQKLYSERMELATEQMTKCLLAAWR